MIYPPCPLALKQVLFALMQHFNCDLISITLIVFQPKLYLEFNSLGTSCHLKEAIVLTTTRPDSVFKIFPFLFQLYNFNTNEDQALINKKLPKELILRYYFLKLNKVSGRSTSKLRSTKKIIHLYWFAQRSSILIVSAVFVFSTPDRNL